MKLIIIFICLFVLISACSTSLHGSFVTTSHVGPDGLQDAMELGVVEGRSCQTQPLYILAIGDQATTNMAIENAKNVFSDTSFIADISIDDETLWRIGYSVQCIVVHATAYRN